MSDSIQYSDGHAALRATLDFRTNANSEIVCGIPVSPSTLTLLTGAIPAAGRTVRFIDLGTPGALTAAVNRRTRVILVEPGAGDDLGVPDSAAIVATLRSTNEDRFEEERAVLVVRSSTALPPPAPSDGPETLVVRADGTIIGDASLIAALHAHQNAVGGRADDAELVATGDPATAIADEVSGHAALAAVHQSDAFPSLLVLEFGGVDAPERAATFAEAIDAARPSNADPRTLEALGRRPGRVRLEAGSLTADQVRRALDATL